MTVVQLEYLIALNQYRSYSEAARNCNVTQPTLSMQLRKLEDSFGSVLVKKGKTPISFTLLGQSVIEQAKVVVQEFENLKHIQNISLGNNNTEITIGIIPTIAAYMVPELSNYIHENLNHLTVHFKELKTENLIESVSEMDLDYGIMSGPYTGPLKNKELYHEPIMVYSDLHGKTVDLKTLKAEKAWFLTKGNCFRMQMFRLCEYDDYQESSGVNFEGESLSTLINMIDRNGGYTLVPKYFMNNSESKKNNLSTITGVNAVRSIIGISRRRNAYSEILSKIETQIEKIYKKNIDNPYILLIGDNYKSLNLSVSFNRTPLSVC